MAVDERAANKAEAATEDSEDRYDGSSSSLFLSVPLALDPWVEKVRRRWEKRKRGKAGGTGDKAELEAADDGFRRAIGKRRRGVSLCQQCCGERRP